MISKTRLRMLPVCEYGYVFKDGVDIYNEYVDISDGLGSCFKREIWCIDPPKCPICKREIEAIEYLKEGFKW